MALEITDYGDVYLVKFGPEWTWQDMQDMRNYFRANPDPSPDRPKPRLVDFRQTRKVDLNFNKMTSYTQSILPSPIAENLKIAIVVASPMLLGFARMFQTLVEPELMQVEIFESMTSALDWLVVGQTTRKALES